MPLKTISTGRGLMGGGTYADKVLGFDPIAYWPLWEGGGTVARCLTNPAMNGTYSSDVSTWPVGPGIGDGNTAPGFDGANDYINVLTAALNAAFNGPAGTLFQWVRVANVGIWTDGVRRDSAFWFADGTNYLLMGKSAVNNTWADNYVAGGVAETVSPGGLTATDWVPTAITWDKSAEEYKLFRFGAQVGATQVALGVWAGALTLAIIGATTPAPANLWLGWIAHCAAWSRALTPTEIAALAVV